MINQYWSVTRAAWAVHTYIQCFDLTKKQLSPVLKQNPVPEVAKPDLGKLGCLNQYWSVTRAAWAVHTMF
jgi:hypothetical protein